MLVVILFWGHSFVSIKIAVQTVPPVTLALLRFIIASVLLFLMLRTVEPSARLAKADVLRMGLAGFLGITLYFWFENSGIQLTTASNAALISSIIPILAIMLDVGLYKTKISVNQFVGIGLAVIGSYLAITANGQAQLDSGLFKGNLLIVGAMVSWVLFTLCNKSFGSKYSGLMATTWQHVIGTVFLLPLAVTEHREWKPIPVEIWVQICYLAIFCSAACYLLYMFALKKLDVTVTTMYINLVPIVGVMSGYFFLGETVLPIQLLGGAVIIGGIVLVNLKIGKRAVKSPVNQVPN